MTRVPTQPFCTYAPLIFTTPVGSVIFSGHILQNGKQWQLGQTDSACSCSPSQRSFAPLQGVLIHQLVSHPPRLRPLSSSLVESPGSAVSSCRDVLVLVWPAATGNFRPYCSGVCSEWIPQGAFGVVPRDPLQLGLGGRQRHVSTGVKNSRANPRASDSRKIPHHFSF